jgi:hypothetical protein
MLDSEMEEIPKESAQQRANRIWNNARLQRKLVPTTKSPSLIAVQDEQFDRVLARFKTEIRSIMLGPQRNNLNNYLIALQIKHKALLKEKLRRLMEKDNE